MHRQAVLVSVARSNRVLPYSSAPGLAGLIGLVGGFHSIRAGGGPTPRRGLLATIDSSVTQESFQTETHVGLHYYGEG